MQMKEIRNQIIEKINEVVEPYQLIMTEPDMLNKYIEFLKKKLNISLKRIDEYELLYTEELSLNMITAYLSDEIGNLLTNSFVDGIVFNKEFVNSDIGKQIQEAENIQNYQGFDLTNQDGQFSKNSQKQSVAGGTTKLQYLAYLQSYTSEWIKYIVNWIITNMCVIIY